jgi:hypothetical protein
MKARKLMFTNAIALITLLAIPVGLPAQGNPDRNNQHHHYTLIDMGTFGGPNSSQTSGGPGALNQRGVTVGWSATSVSTSPTSNPTVERSPAMARRPVAGSSNSAATLFY